MTVTHAFQVDLRGVVDLLSHHLYSGPDVFVRELLQNAFDALTAAGVDPAAGPPVTIHVQPDGRGCNTVSVHDDGIGLAADEVRDLLATIGASSKRDDLLGRFGIGLLSCFLVTDEIVVLTLSRTGTPGVRWTGRSDGSYDLEELPPGVGRTSPGTTVVLSTRAGLDHVTSPGAVLGLARRFVGLSDRAVVVESPSGRTTVGGQPLPWVAAAQLDPGSERTRLLEIGEELLGDRFLDAVPLHLPAAGLTGVAFVLASSPSPTARQGHRVHLRRMLLSDSVVGLTPDWAFFARVVIDADSLRPLASREGLYEDETLAAVREAIGAALRSWLVRLADHEPERLRALMRVHVLALKSLAVHDDELLGLFAGWLPIETSLGRMTLQEAAARSPQLRYAETTETFHQLAQVAAAQGALIVNAGYTYDAELVRRLPHVLAGVDVSALDAAAFHAELAEVDPEHRSRADSLAARAGELLAPLGCAVVVRAFSPSSLPALYVVGEDARQTRAADEVADLAGGFWGSLVSGMSAGLHPDTPTGPVLTLNYRHSVVPTLVDRTDDDLRTALQVLYLQALLLGRHPLRGREVAVLSAALVRLLEPRPSA